MDLKINAEYEGENNPIWDIKVKNGIAPIIYGEEENVQTATLACFLVFTSSSRHSCYSAKAHQMQKQLHNTD